MIVKAGSALRGGRVRGLLAYLLGPGRHTEHVDPRVIGGWEPLEFLLGANGRPHASQIGELTRALELPVRAVRECLRPRKYVWHCIVQNDRRVDPVLSDDQWATIAAELVDAAGLGGHRWLVVRHDDHGIHIAATLVSEDGQRASLRHEIRRLNACRVRLEAKYCRRRTDPGTRTGGVAYARHEREKAIRCGATRPVRVRLRNAIETACLSTSDPAAFTARLRDQGVLVEFRYSQRDAGQITGYKVALADDLNGDGAPVWYKASAIDRSLTWPKILIRWGQAPPEHHRRSVQATANAYVARARIARDILTTRRPGAVDVGPGLADLVRSLHLTRPTGLRDEQWDALLDRAFWISRPPGGRSRGRPDPVSRGLQTAARTLAGHGAINRAGWVAIATEAVAAIAALQRVHALAHHRRHAEHAATIADTLRAVVHAAEQAATPPSPPVSDLSSYHARPHSPERTLR